MDKSSAMLNKVTQNKDDISIRMFTNIINKMSYLIVHELCEKAITYTLIDENNNLSIRDNQFAYLIVTDRFENKRNTKDKLMEATITNLKFLKELEAKAKTIVITDGPNCVCFLNVEYLIGAVKLYQKLNKVRDNILFSLIEKYNMSYNNAVNIRHD